MPSDSGACTLADGEGEYSSIDVLVITASDT